MSSSTGLVLAALPAVDPAAQARSLQRDLVEARREIAEQQERVAELERELREERRQRAMVERGAVALRQVLTPLYQALGMVFGELDAAGVEASDGVSAGTAPATAATARPSSPVWESWKQRLGGASAKIIDILLLHGELSQEQIRIHVGTNRKQTIYDAISKLNKAGVIVKRDGKISLKDV